MSAGASCICINGPESTCPIHGPQMAAERAEAVATFDEVELAADLWRRLVTAWESSEEDELVDQIAALVDEWQGFVGKKEEG